MRAQEMLRKLFNVENEDIISIKSRKRNKIDARKFFNYYLWKHCNIKHSYMKFHIEGMHHSTSIYFKNKLEFELTQYPEIQQDWDSFLLHVDHAVWREQLHIKTAMAKYLI